MLSIVIMIERKPNEHQIQTRDPQFHIQRKALKMTALSHTTLGLYTNPVLEPTKAETLPTRPSFYACTCSRHPLHLDISNRSGSRRTYTFAISSPLLSFQVSKQEKQLTRSNSTSHSRNSVQRSIRSLCRAWESLWK